MFELKIKDYEEVEEIPIQYYDKEMTCIKLDDESKRTKCVKRIKRY